MREGCGWGMYVHYNYAVWLVCYLFVLSAQNYTTKQDTSRSSPNKVCRKTARAVRTLHGGGV